MVAEAFGLRAAMALMLRSRRFVSHVCIIGDNAPVLKYAVGEARLRRVDLSPILETPLAAIALAGSHPCWMAVRRAFNKAADQLATRAVEQAFDMHPQDRVSIEEHNMVELSPALGWELSIGL